MCKLGRQEFILAAALTSYFQVELKIFPPANELKRLSEPDHVFNISHSRTTELCKSSPVFFSKIGSQVAQTSLDLDTK